jgi:UDP-glucose 4-epimerase
VHLLDVVCANVAAMEHGDGEVLNVATGVCLTIRELMWGRFRVEGE